MVGRAAARVPRPRRRPAHGAPGGRPRDGRRRGGRRAGSRHPTGRWRSGTRAVVLATGGFEFDQDLVRDFLRGPIRHPAGVPTNTGDGLLMAMRIGARARQHARGLVGPGRRTAPHRRRRPPAGPAGPARADPAAVAHGQPLRRPVHQRGGQLQRPRRRLPPVRRGARSATSTSPAGWSWTRASSTGTAASAPRREGRCRTGCSAPTTCRRWPHGSASPRTRSRPRSPRFNGLAEKGHDDDFGRGDSAYDGWCGDRSAYPGTAATLGPVDTAPFYAVELISSTLGTKGGPRTDVDGAVLHVDGDVDPRPVRGGQRDGRARPGWSTAAPAARSARRWSSATGPGAQPRAAPPECLYRGNGTSGEVPFPRKWHLRRR